MLPFSHEQQKKLSEVSSLGVGGPARFFAIAHSKEMLRQMIVYCYNEKLPYIIIGKGSNCLFDDRGYDGLVILNKIDYLEQKENLFIVGAGYSFARLGSQTARLGWSGLEFASGIPASVGGAIFMNAGANGKETADKLVSVEYIDSTGELRCLARSELSFGYRTSSFHHWKGAIVEGTFSLLKSEEAKKTQKTLLGHRLKTQPYGDKSAGCAFRNPVSCAAGQLIDQCGLKGMKVGGAQVSLMHGNFIINAEGSTAEDIKLLMKRVQETVLQQTGILYFLCSSSGFSIASR